MVVIVLEKVPASLRGELTRWMLEVQTNVFVGSISAIVRDELWNHAREKARGGSGVLVHTSNNEQGFKFQMFGSAKRNVVDIEGLNLIQITK